MLFSMSPLRQNDQQILPATRIAFLGAPHCFRVFAKSEDGRYTCQQFGLLSQFSPDLSQDRSTFPSLVFLDVNFLHHLPAFPAQNVN